MARKGVAQAKSNNKERPSDDVDAPAPRGRRGFRLLLLFAVLLLLLCGAGGAWYFLLGGESRSAAKEAEPTVPAFVEVKPFVVTIRGADGNQHYLQLGLSLTVPGADAVTSVDQVMPLVLDAMRQTILSYKAEDLETTEGVNKLRADLVENVNGVLVRALGVGKIKKLGGVTEKALVQNIYFSNLVIE